MTASRSTHGGPGIRRAATALALVVAAGVLVLGTPSSARAHDGLVATTPAGGAAVAVAPEAVELQFTGEPLPLGTLVAVTGPGGTSASSGQAEIRGTTVTQQLAADTPAGAYRVEWRSTSSDGHALSGTFDFTVTEGVGAPSAADATSPVTPDVRSDSTAAGTGVAPVWPVAGAVVLLGLGAVVGTRVRRRG
jgi:methionine-rich copper-binding protein CopC